MNGPGVCDADVAQPKDWGGGHLQCCRQRKWALPILHSVAAGGGGRASPQGRLSELSGSIRSRVPFQGCGPVARATHLSGRLSPRSFLKLPPCHPPHLTLRLYSGCSCTSARLTFLDILKILFRPSSGSHWKASQCYFLLRVTAISNKCKHFYGSVFWLGQTTGLRKKDTVTLTS